LGFPLFEGLLENRHDHIRGLVGEIKGGDVFIKSGYTKIMSKIEGKQCFDHLFVKYGKNREIIDIVAVESKYNGKGIFKLGQTRTSGEQMSRTWIEESVEILLKEDSAELKDVGTLIKQNLLQVRKMVNVVDQHGNNVFYRKIREVWKPIEN